MRDEKAKGEIVRGRRRANIYSRRGQNTSLAVQEELN